MTTSPVTPLTKEQVQEAIRNLFEESERFHNITFAHPAEEPSNIFLIVYSWEERGELNDALNEKLNEVTGGLWTKARPIYQAAHDAEFDRDRARNPGAHPSNCGRTGGPFASLGVKNGEIAAENVGEVPCIVPEGLVDVDRADEYGVECGFSDQHTTCDDCRCVLFTDESPRAFFEDDSGNTLCRDCMDKDDYLGSRLNTAGIVHEGILGEEDLKELGFARIVAHKDKWCTMYLTYETGLHEGQDDDVLKVLEALNEEEIDCVFTADVRQFDVEYTPWVRFADFDELDKDPLEAENFRTLCVICGETGQAHQALEENRDALVLIMDAAASRDEGRPGTLGESIKKEVESTRHEFLPSAAAAAAKVLEGANVKLKHSPHDSAKAALQSLSKPFASINIQKDGSATVDESSTIQEYLGKQR